MFVPSPISVWSMAVLPGTLPEKSGCGEDHPLAFVGSLEVR